MSKDLDNEEYTDDDSYRYIGNGIGSYSGYVGTATTEKTISLYEIKCALNDLEIAELEELYLFINKVCDERGAAKFRPVPVEPQKDKVDYELNLLGYSK